MLTFFYVDINRKAEIDTYTISKVIAVVNDGTPVLYSDIALFTTLIMIK